jgi:hypothetical protein
MIWQNRTCKVEEGMVMLSKVQDPDNWDLPVAFTLPGPVTGEEQQATIVGVEVIDDERLRVIGSDGSRWLLIGNPADGGRIEREI